MFDTSVASDNLGDFIIMDAVRRETVGLLPDLQRVTLPTHDSIGKYGRRILRRSSLAMVGGTNLLSSHLLAYRQFKLRAMDLPYLGEVVLAGVGWWQYQAAPDRLSGWLYRKLLSKKFVHSVRDSYTARQLNQVGVSNVLNTGCLTMWQLTPEHCASTPMEKSDAVVFTLTDYKQDLERDSALIRGLFRNFNRIVFWPQGVADIRYFKSLTGFHHEQVRTLPPSLEAFNAELVSGEVDYIGTRLHAGIRAMQRGVRTFIVAVDNRATEKRRDFGLPVLEREELPNLDAMIRAKTATSIRLPMEAIARWRGQFS